MILTLEIIGPDAGKLGADRRKVFDASGGTIGRQGDSSWVLQDPYVSSRHALIRYADGVFYIEDTRSRNGVYINSTDNRLDEGQAYALRTGDRILIEPYEIGVSIASPSPQRVEIQDPFGVSAVAAPAMAAVSSFASVVREDSTPLPVHDVDPLNLLGLDGDASSRPNAPRAEHLAASSPLSDHYEAPVPSRPEPPKAARPAAMIPDDYNLLGSDSQIVPAPAARLAVPGAPPARHGAEAARPKPRAEIPGAAGARVPARIRHDVRDAGALADVLAGAGLTDVPVTRELAQNFGEILRVVVAGVMDVLQARQRIKDEFRIRVTTFKRADNNPLKFSANVDDALHNLLVKRNSAYLAPVDAFEDAFDDLRHHQLAMLAGLRAAFEAMLAEFEPDRLQEEFDRQLKKGSPLLAAPSKLRYWDLYREKVQDMVRDAEATFRGLFGDEFAKAYEEQLERLKSKPRSGER